MNVEKSNQSTLEQSYEAVYKNEATGIQPLNTKRWPRNRWEALVRAVPEKAGHVLEIGCGNGVVLYHIAEKAKSLTGIEVSKRRAEVAQENLAGQAIPVSILSGNIESETVQFPHKFQTIIWADVIEHVVDVFHTMKTITALLDEGGTLITSTPNIAYLPHRMRLLFGYFPSTAAKKEGFAVRDGEMYDGGHLHYFTPNTLKQLYLMNQIHPIQMMGFGRFGWLHTIHPLLLSGSAFVVGKKQSL